MKFQKLKYLLVLLLFPIITFAFSLKDSTFSSTVSYIIDVLSVLVPILFALAFIVFFWGLSKFILNSGSKADIEKGRSYMLWGILALFILISFRTIVGIISSDLDLGNSQTIPFLPSNTSQ